MQAFPKPARIDEHGRRVRTGGIRVIVAARNEAFTEGWRRRTLLLIRLSEVNDLALTVAR